MNNFTLDIERFYEAIAESGGHLRGIASIQYPIYCVHASIMDTSAAPFDNLDRVICEFLYQKSDIKPHIIATMMGTSSNFVSERLRSLLTDDLIERNGKGGFQLTNQGTRVFREAFQEREHRRSYDFYIDGITLKPLSRTYYTTYRQKLISEGDSYFYTNYKGETVVARPFGPDIVHTPPNRIVIQENIFSIPKVDREDYAIPPGLKAIDEVFYTKQTFQLLIAISEYAGQLTKELIDGHALFSLNDKISYYEAVKRQIRIFEPQLAVRLPHLEFQLEQERFDMGNEAEGLIRVITNWPEIDRATPTVNRCFAFSSEDLEQLCRKHFQLDDLVPLTVINQDNEVGIRIDLGTLLGSADRRRLVRNISRERDYKFGNSAYVFIMYLTVVTDDEVVRNVVQLRQYLRQHTDEQSIQPADLVALTQANAGNYRELLLAGGELELLERIDIKQYMLDINRS